MQSRVSAHDAVGFDCCCKRGLRDRMNIIAAAEAHVVWKNRLGNYVRGLGLETLGAATLGQDGVCQLGNLINGSALLAFHDMPEYDQLREAHEQFHQLSCEVVDKLNAGDRDAAIALFENEYSTALRVILASLSKMNRSLLG